MEVGKVVIFGMNGVGVGRNGARLWENDGRRSRKVFKYLLGFWEAIKNSKIGKKTGNGEMTVNYRIFEYSEYSPY